LQSDGDDPIIIKLVEVVECYKVKEKTASHSFELDSDVELKYWPHPADAVTIREVADNEEASVQAYTDGSKHDQGVGSGAAIFIGGKKLAHLKLKLDIRCSNNQAEQLATVKALEATESLHEKTSTHALPPYSLTVGSPLICFTTLTAMHALSKILEKG
jgi:hypothetical protein